MEYFENFVVEDPDGRDFISWSHFFHLLLEVIPVLVQHQVNHIKLHGLENVFHAGLVQFREE